MAVSASEPARVRPRIVSPVTGEALPLEDLIGQLIQDGQYKLVGLVGGPGAGKSTALRHLASVLPPWALARVRLVDYPKGYPDIVAAFSKSENVQLVISAGSSMPAAPCQVIYRLASWSQDDVIEYLLSAHWDRCASVMTRLRSAHDRGFLKGIPELWTVVLDRMARDESIRGIRAALRRETATFFDQHPRARIIVEDFCLNGVAQNGNLGLDLPLSLLSADIAQPEQRADDLLRLIRHRPVAVLVAADRIKEIAESGQVESAFARQFPRDLVQEAALAIADHAVALQHLSDWMSRRDCRNVHPMAASILLAVTPGGARAQAVDQT